MPGIDNRAVWDKGIGPAAETIFSSSAPATMASTPTNYNTGAWSQDQTVQPPTTTTPASSSGNQPVKQAIGGGPVTPAMSGGQNQQTKPSESPNSKYIANKQAEIQQLQIQLNYLMGSQQNERNRREIEKIRYQLMQKQQEIAQAQANDKKFGY
jgi:hypothetical protein